VSAERIRHELELILAEVHSRKRAICDTWLAALRAAWGTPQRQGCCPGSPNCTEFIEKFRAAICDTWFIDESSAGARLVLHVAADDEVVRRNLDRYEHEWQYVHPVLTGDDLRKLGPAAGPRLSCGS
jgi:hypothetical protein